MFRSPIRSLLSVLTVLVLGAAALAQSNQNSPTASTGNAAGASQTSTPSAISPVRRAPHSRRTCWGEAGITPDKVNEEWKIRDAGKVRISGVCSDPRLTAQKKAEKILSINQETDTEIARLIPEKQLAVYKACETQREAEAKAKARGPQPKELGPCGGTIPPNSQDHGTHDHSAMSDQHH